MSQDLENMFKGHDIEIIDEGKISMQKEAEMIIISDDPIKETTEEVKQESTESVDEFKQIINSTIEESGILKEDTIASLDLPKSTNEEPAPAKELHLGDIISEKTNGRYADLDAILMELESLKSREYYASEDIKKLNDLASQGKDIYKVLEYQKLNPESFDASDINTAVELLKIKIKKEDHEITEREVKMILKSEYNLKDADDYNDEEEKELAYIKIKRKAKAVKEELIKEKKEYTLSDPEFTTKKQQEQAELRNKVVQQWKDSVNDVTASYTEQTFKITDKDGFTFKVKDDTRSNVRNVMGDLDTFWNRYIKSDGSRDMDKLKKDMLLLQSQDEIIKAVYAQGISKGAKDVIEDLKNNKPSQKSSASTASKETHVDIIDQIRNYKPIKNY